MLEFDGEADVELSTGEIVGYGVLDIIDICHPIIAADVGNVKEVEAVETQHDAAEMTPEVVRAYTICRSTD